MLFLRKTVLAYQCGFLALLFQQGPGGEIGKHSGLKIRRR